MQCIWAEMKYSSAYYKMAATPQDDGIVLKSYASAPGESSEAADGAESSEPVEEAKMLEVNLNSDEVVYRPSGTEEPLLKVQRKYVCVCEVFELLPVVFVITVGHFRHGR